MIALLAAAAAPAIVPGAFAGIPGVSVATYPVRGSDIAAIRASLDANGPVDPNDGSHVEAITHWHFAWRWPGVAGGWCRLAAATVRFEAVVTLPELVGPVPPDVAARWARYRAALERHESNHARYAWQHLGEVRAAIRQATCATAESAGQAVLADIIAHDLAYDRETNHGEREGAVFP